MITTLALLGPHITALYARVNCSFSAFTTNTPTTCTLPSDFPITGPDATVINPSFAVKYSGPSNDFIGGNQCTPDCPWGAKFIGIPNFVSGPGPANLPSYIDTPSYDAYSYGIFSILDKNQCTYGAIAMWLTLHQPTLTNSNPEWSPSYILSFPPIHDNAGAMYQRALDAGYTVSATPLSGSLVVYRDNWISASPLGHLATVVGVSPDGKHYTVVEQNVLYDELNDESGAGFPPYRWNLGGFDIRTAAFPDPGIAGFIYGPPGTTLPTDPAIIDTGMPAPTPSPVPSPTPSPT